MLNVAIRLATLSDVDELVEMRRAFTIEDMQTDAQLRPEYEAECSAFLRNAVSDGRWHIWVAESAGEIVSHVFVALVDKVPRPTRRNSMIAYLTNVYTKPPYRGQGAGARLIQRAQQAAYDDGVELMIVWPSEPSVGFYEREGFIRPDEPLIWEG